MSTFYSKYLNSNVGISSVNGLTGALTLAAGTNITLGTVGNTITINASGGGGSGVDTLAAIGAVPNANAATISGTTLNLQPASASFGGVVTTGTQAFGGAKQFALMGINAAATTGSLHVKANGTNYDSALTLESTSGAHKWNVYPETNGYLYIRNVDMSLNPIIIDNTAKTSIGGITAESTLTVGMASDVIQLSVNANGTQTSNLAQFKNTAGTVKVHIDGTGKTFLSALQIADGTQSNGYVLTSDASGNSTWQANSGGGANTTLSNLVADTALNVSILPANDRDPAINLGSSGRVFYEGQIAHLKSVDDIYDAGNIQRLDLVNNILNDETSVEVLHFASGARYFADPVGEIALNFSTTANVVLQSNADDGVSRNLVFNNADDTFGVSVHAPNTLAANTNFTLPPDNGTSGNILATDGGGITTWSPGLYASTSFTDFTSCSTDASVQVDANRIGYNTTILLYAGSVSTVVGSLLTDGPVLDTPYRPPNDVNFPLISTTNGVSQIGVLTIKSNGELKFYADPAFNDPLVTFSWSQMAFSYHTIS